MNWDQYFSGLCRLVAQKSKRPTKVGCVIVGPDKEIRTTGYNGFPRGTDDNRPDWQERPKKGLVTVHAEVNAIFNAARVGIPLKDCTAYVSLPPCAVCAQGIIQSGIRMVKVLEAAPDWGPASMYKESFEVARELFKSGGVVVYTWELDKFEPCPLCGSGPCQR